MSVWIGLHPRPMDEAPRDGSRILAWDQTHEHWTVICFDKPLEFHDGTWYQLADGALIDTEEFSCWVPEPLPPVESEIGSGIWTISLPNLKDDGQAKDD